MKFSRDDIHYIQQNAVSLQHEQWRTLTIRRTSANLIPSCGRKPGLFVGVLFARCLNVEKHRDDNVAW